MAELSAERTESISGSSTWRPACADCGNSKGNASTAGQARRAWVNTLRRLKDELRCTRKVL
jgi:ribosomal protein L19E